MVRREIKKPLVISGIILLVFSAVLGVSTFSKNKPKNPREESQAMLFILPEQGTFILDEVFQITLNVSADAEINAASGKLCFPPDELKVIDISEEESILKFWIIEPFYSNDDGIIQFIGSLPSPGFKGEQGKILTITFKAIKEGKANIEIEEGLVLANDERGTNILKELKGASFAILGLTAADLNNDNYINNKDLDILLANWGIAENSRADINKDGEVNMADFSILLFNLEQ